MELAFAGIAFVLLVSVAYAGVNILGLNVKYLDTVIKKHAIIQAVKLGLLDLLDVTKKLVLLPSVKLHTTICTLFFENTFQQIVFGQSLKILSYPAEFDFDAFATS
jgi:hypothetical protein